MIKLTEKEIIQLWAEKCKKAALVLNGSDLPGCFFEYFIVAADGAYDKLKCPVSAVIGDFDSSALKAEDIPDTVEVVKLDAIKEMTDGEAGLDYILSRGYKDITVYGALGGRQDHVIYNLTLLAIADKHKGVTVRAVGGGTEVRFISKRNPNFKMSVNVGTVVSIVPFSSRVHIMETKGLFYPLKDEDLLKKSTRGISNAAVDTEIKISLSKGEAFVFVIAG
ncbi:MAG: thiamine diphosphokinase [Clostridiaceae bacterium]|jgi:thiamine pyrophosphokinase|nr:thiamine diphosphokinase [Clostridiaceae bacterium]